MSDKPSDQRHAQREQEKHDGRTRRAELMLTKQAQQKARQDVLEGRMIVEIGVAAVRPAEFIILRFSHKLAEA